MTGTRKGPCFCLQKDYISARILVGEILYNGVRADFLRKRGQNMTGDLTSDKEKMARERRKRKQLERVRQVERAKQRLRRGVFGGFLVLILGIGLFRWQQNRRAEEAWQDYEAENYLSGDNQAADGQTASDPEVRAEYLNKLQALASSDERYQTILDQAEEYPDNVLRMVCQNEETLNFAVDYPEKKDSEPASTVGDVTKGVVPLLIQWDRRWGYALYGSSTIVAVSGCGPTCIAMVACGLTGRNDITPAKVASYSANNGFLTESRDTSWDLMTYGAEEYGITGTELGLDEAAMANQLAAGHPIIASMGAGDFTSSGHFIVLTGYANGSFTVNDPNSLVRSGETWSFERLKNQIVNLCYKDVNDFGDSKGSLIFLYNRKIRWKYLSHKKLFRQNRMVTQKV